MENQNNLLPEFELAGRYLAGEASPEEAIRVDDWRKQSKENEILFNQMSDVWQASGITGDAYIKPRLDTEWNLLQDKINTKQTPRIPLVRITAAVVLLIGIAWAAWYFSGTRGAAGQLVTVIADTGMRKVQLPDGSNATLNAGGSLEYPAKFARTLSLKGGGLFHVTHNASQPFMIAIDSVTIKVLGTTFNVHATDTSVKVSVIEGVVMMKYLDDSIIIRKDQSGLYDKRTLQLRLLETSYLDELDYGNHSFRFDNVSLLEIKEVLEKTYPIRIEFTNPSIGNCRIKTEFENASLNYILEVISNTVGTQVSKSGRTVYFTGDGCD